MGAPLIKLQFSLNDLKKDLGGVANRLAQDAVTSLENKLENAVEGAFTGLLKKIGLSSTTAGILSARFGDALLHGMADDYFKTGGPEINRVTPEDICNNVTARTGSETDFEAHNRLIDNTFGKNPAALQFPQHLGDYFMIMKFADYKRPAPQVTGELKFTQAITLPIPKDLSENFGIKIADQGLGAMGGIADIAQAAAVGEDGKAIRDSVVGLAYGMLQSKGGEAGSVIGQLAGAVANPFAAAIFQGMSLRTHSFDWMFAPRNKAESEMLQNIVLSLKQNALPTYSTEGIGALSYPRICQLELYPWQNKPGYELIKFKPCLISNISVNYSPTGIPSFFAGTQLPTFVHIKLDMMEMEIVTANDYGITGGRDNIATFIKEGSNILDAIAPGASDEINKTTTQIAGALGQGAKAGAAAASKEKSAP